MTLSPIFRARFSRLPAWVLALCLALGLLAGPAAAQQFRVQNFASVVGAPQGFVYTSLQDHRGFLWVGTGDGLYRYDGTSFQRYSVADGLTENFVTTLFEDASGRLWVGHYQGGLSCLPETGGPFRRVRRPANFSSQIVGMTQAPEGVWVASQRSGLLFLPDVAPDRTQFFPMPKGENRLVKAVADVHGRLFIAFEVGGITELLVEGPGRALRSRGSQVLYAENATVLLPDTAASRLIVGTASGACYAFPVRPNGLGYQRQLLVPEVVKHMGSICGVFLSPRNHGLWLAGSQGMVVLVTPRADHHITTTAYPLGHQLAPFPLNTILEDAEGALWLGTAGDGLRCFTDRHITLFDAAATGWPKAPVTALSRGSDGALLAGTPEGLFATVPNGIGGFSSRPVRHGLPGRASIRRVLYAPRRGTWVGTADQGLWFRAATDSLYRHIRLPENPSTITSLAIDPDGRIWVGTGGQGAYWLSADGSLVIQHYTTANGLLHNTIYDILRDRKGHVWFASHGTGLVMREPGGRFRVVQLTTGGVDVNAMAETSDGDVWLATSGDGIFIYHHDTFLHRSTADAPGLASDYAFSLLPLANGSMEVGHQSGMSYYDGRTRTFIRLDRSSTDLLRLFNPGAAVTDATGLTRWFGTTQGLLRLTTPVGGESTYVPAAVVTDISLQDQLVTADALRALPYGTYKVAFAYRGIALAEAGRLQYRYRLLGSLSSYDWSPATTANEAVYRRLQEGSYTFEVQARLGPNAKWSSSTRLAFEIATPFWKTLWFALAVVVGVVASARAWLRWRLAQLEQAKRELEKAVDERTDELRKEKERAEQINAELVIAKDAADASRRAKAQFLANMSHEIRTPMNAVVGMTHLLTQTHPSAEQRDYIQAIAASSQNLMVIINDILDSSKIEAGKLTLERTPFRLPELLRQVRQLFRTQAEAKRLTLEVDVAPDVPAVVVGDSVRLNQILINLVGNAIKFTPGGSIRVEVRVDKAGSTTAGRSAVVFAVRDTGIGIPADKLETIFEDFSQANTSTTRHFGGTGLGLSIARNLVRLHGGDLLVESREGTGSTFSFTIPYEVATDADAPRSDAPVAFAPFQPPLRVLVVEDNELNQLVARRTLERWQCRITVAGNGRIGLEVATADVFDAVLMDVQMPEMDGYEATRRIRQLPGWGQVPIIGLTASVLPEDRQLAIESGMTDTLGKPFDPAHLYALLRRLTVAPTALPLPALPAPAQPTYVLDTPDWAHLDELAPGQPSFVAQVIDTFLQQAPTLLAALQVAATGADWGTLARTSHKLKGQIAYFGLPHLHQLLGTLETSQSPTEARLLRQRTTEVIERLNAVLPLLHARRQELLETQAQ